jgi:TonB-dependent SusC/RagA subfamily outer membrane receptor
LFKLQSKELAELKEMSKEKRDEMMKERMHLMEEREAMSEERRREIEERVEKARAEHKEMSEERRHEIEMHVKQARKEHEKAREEYKVQRKMIIKERMKDKGRVHDSLIDKHSNIFIIKEGDHDGNEMFFNGKNKAMIIVDGEESDEKVIELLSPEDIAHVNVLKGEHAIKMYGTKGKEGVVIITTKEHGENEFVYEFEHKMDDPHVEVIIDPNMELEWVSEYGNVEIQTIDKNTSNEDLKAIKSDFKSKNIDFSFSKLKRNKEGEITRIKISLDDNDGDKTSATFNHTDKYIPHIILGKNRNNLFIKSN